MRTPQAPQLPKLPTERQKLDAARRQHQKYIQYAYTMHNTSTFSQHTIKSM